MITGASPRSIFPPALEDPLTTTRDDDGSDAGAIVSTRAVRGAAAGVTALAAPQSQRLAPTSASVTMTLFAYAGCVTTTASPSARSAVDVGGDRCIELRGHARTDVATLGGEAEHHGSIRGRLRARGERGATTSRSKFTSAACSTTDDNICAVLAQGSRRVGDARGAGDERVTSPPPVCDQRRRATR